MKQLRKYSEAFKLQIIREIEEGKYKTVAEASEANSIRGAQTVANWVEKYGKANLLRKVMRVETVGERTEIKRLKDRVRELEGALADAHLDLRIEKTYLELACKAGGIEDVDAFKKKQPGKPCTR